MRKGLFITFEGTEGCGKSTHVRHLGEALRNAGHETLVLREPGGTPIGEEIRHTLKHSHQNQAMTAEAELLLMNASRAQLVREVIRPALNAGKMVLSDRFHDSTIAYQGYGRGLDLDIVTNIIQFSIGTTHPDLTLLLTVPVSVSETRRAARQARNAGQRDRMEEADREFFLRVENGFRQIAAAEPERVKVISSMAEFRDVRRIIWQHVEALLARQSASLSNPAS